jgi:hypothetical protein
MNRKISWGKGPFQLVMWGCGLFIFLTLIAMLIYPGGNRIDPTAQGYTFFYNFFSELGYTVTISGVTNPIAAPLFFVALTSAGLGMVLFFLVYLQFFWGQWYLKMLSVLGTVCGVVSGMAYVGIAFTPANLLPGPHVQFVLLAFRAFFPAVLFYMLAIFLNPDYPNRYAAVYLVFGVLLAAYILLLTRGPGMETSQGVIIQVVGQKIIGYAAIITIFVQSWGTVQLLNAVNE